MPIEFYCPGCGKRMRTPDETAGRKGRCPQCSTKVQIPLESIAGDTQDLPRAHEEEERIFCNHCQAPLRFPPGSEGMHGSCPHCKGPITIPDSSDTPRWRDNMQVLHFHCPACREMMKATRNTAGKRGKCPSCQQWIRIPAD